MSGPQPTSPMAGASRRAGDGGPVAALDPRGRLIGLVQIDDGSARVLVNFPADEVLE